MSLYFPSASVKSIIKNWRNTGFEGHLKELKASAANKEASAPASDDSCTIKLRQVELATILKSFIFVKIIIYKFFC